MKLLLYIYGKFEDAKMRGMRLKYTKEKIQIVISSSNV